MWMTVERLLDFHNVQVFIYSREATSQARACSHLATAARVKYPAPQGELAKKKLSHAPLLAAGYLTEKAYQF